jgi:hypothetical protein
MPLSGFVQSVKPADRIPPTVATICYNRCMSNALTSDQIAGLFAQRLPAAGGWISAKQIDWLLSQFARENRIPRPRVANGELADGREWTATKSGNANGAGTLHLVSVAAREAARAEARAKDAYEARCKALNDKITPLVLAGKSDEVRALLEAFAAEEGR